MQVELQSAPCRQQLAAVNLPRTSPSHLPDGDAISLLTMVVGTPTHTLRGFSCASAVKRFWTHPNYVFISAPVSPMDLVAPLQRAGRQQMYLMGFAAFGGALMVFALGAVLASARINTDAVRALQVDSASSWSVIRLERQAVVLKTPGADIRVQVGDRLPNGDLIVSVAPERNTVLLASGALVLGPPPRPQAQR